MSWWQFWKRGKKEGDVGLGFTREQLAAIHREQQEMGKTGEQTVRAEEQEFSGEQLLEYQKLQQLLGGINANTTTSQALIKPLTPSLVPAVGSRKVNQGQEIGAAANATFSERVGSGDQAAEDWLNKGNEQFLSGNLQGAIASYDKVLELKPDNHMAWGSRGFALWYLDRYEEAIASYDKALELKPDNHMAWCNRGVALVNLGRNEDAIVSFDKGIAIKPDDHIAWINRGNALGNLGRNEEAIVSYDRVIEIKPDYHEAWNNRGNALGNLGRNEEAIASYDRAIEIKLEDQEAWFNRGNTLVSLGRNEEAITSYDKAIEIKPDKDEAWVGWGTALTNLGRYEEAIAAYNRAIEIKPDDNMAWFNRGVPLGNLGRYEEAIASYNRAIEIKPDDHMAWRNRGVPLSDLGRYKEAIASYNRAIEIKPDDHMAWSNRGNELKNLGRNEDAIASCDKALEIKPDFHQVWLMRGYIVENLSRNYKTASGQPLIYSLQNPAIDQCGYSGQIANYRQGLEFCTHPEGWGELHWYLGRAHYRQGKKQEAPFRLFGEARREYDLALETLTENAFPETYLEVMQDYLKVYRVLEPANLESVGQIAYDCSELVQKLIKLNPSRKESLERKFVGFGQITVDLMLQSGEVGQALEQVEKSKAVCLDWMLPPREPLTWTEMQNQILDPAEALIYWYYSPLELHTILLLPQQAPQLITTTPVDALEKFLTTWNEQYSSYTGKDKTKETSDETWRQQLPNHLTNLTEILSIEKTLPLLSEHNIQNLTLIPHRDLHRLPLHALFPQTLKTRYLPTLHLTSKPSLLQEDRGDLRLLSIEAPDSTDLEAGKPLSSLSYAVIESEYICQNIGAPLQRIANEAATKTQVIHALAQGCQILHFTGHAGYNFANPKKSALCLSKEDRLTIADLVQIPLDGCALVCLSACETGITGKQTILDEYVGLVSAFLAQGVGCVVSTLWQVNSAASAIVMMEFYRQKVQNPTLDNISSLHQTTHWLRTATAHDLKTWWRNLKDQEQLPEIEEIIDSELRTLSRMEETFSPYSNPYYWAAFTITGG